MKQRLLTALTATIMIGCATPTVSPGAGETLATAAPSLRRLAAIARLP